MVKIVWEGEPHPEFDELAEKECQKLLDEGLGCPGDLIFHTIFLDSMEEGRAIDVFGVDGDDRFHLEYIPVLEWVTFDNEGNEIIRTKACET